MSSRALDPSPTRADRGAHGGGGGGGQQQTSGSAAQTRYLCALYGLVRYDVPPSAIPPGVSAPAAAVVRLLALLRWRAASDGTDLLSGRVAAPLLPPATMQAAAGGSRIPLASPSPATPAAPHASYSFAHANPGKLHSSSSLSSLASPSSSTLASGSFTFQTLPTFHEASLALQESSTPGSGGAVAPLGAGSGTGGGGGSSSLAHDLQYLSDRERRLQPLCALVLGSASGTGAPSSASAASGWAALVPERYSRHVRVFRSHAERLAGGELHAWREIRLPAAQPLPAFNLAPPSSSPAPSGVGSSSLVQAHPSHEQWHLSSLGRALLPSRTLAHVRPMRSLAVSPSLLSFLSGSGTTASASASASLGYSFDFEFVQEGFRLPLGEGVEALLYLVLKLPSPGMVSSASVIRGNRWILELRASCVEEQLQATQIKVQALARGFEHLCKFTKLTPEPGATNI